MQDLTFRQMSLKMKRKEEVLGMRYEIKGDTLPVVVCYLEGGEGCFQYSSDRTGAGLAADDADL